MPAAAARTSARSAPSSTCRGASRAAARPTTSRRSSATNFAQGLARFFITDDNFARNKDWEPILDRLIQLREVEKLNISFIIQVDTLCHKLPNFIEKCARAGVKRVFIGLENINPDNLLGAKKRQNKITEYRKMLLAWKNARRHHLCRLHPRLPERHARIDPARHRGDQARAAGRPAGVLLSDAAAGLGGSPQASQAGAPLDPDLNKYDLNHVCTTHPKMSAAEWERAYKMAWQRYYTDEHIETILRRVAVDQGERRARRCSSSPGSRAASISSTSIRWKAASCA